jgi:protein-tyrosine phosphatase
MGNICRSPTAEAVMRHLVAEKGLDAEFELDSAGTGDWHEGEPPDERACHAAARRGLVLDGSARAVSLDDFERFDVIVSVDDANLTKLRRLAPSGSRARLRKLADEDVPDPFYGGDDAFDDVLDRLEIACSALLDELRQG